MTGGADSCKPLTVARRFPAMYKLKITPLQIVEFRNPFNYTLITLWKDKRINKAGIRDWIDNLINDEEKTWKPAKILSVDEFENLQNQRDHLHEEVFSILNDCFNRHVVGDDGTILHECDTDNEASMFINNYTRGDNWGGWDSLTIIGLDDEDGPYPIAKKTVDGWEDC